MLKENYVSFELAKKLKEKGFPQIEFDSSWFNQAGDHSDAYCTDEGLITRPTLAVAQEWLMQEKDMYVLIEKNAVVQEYWYWFESPNAVIYETDMIYGSYKEALEAGINRVIELL